MLAPVLRWILLNHVPQQLLENMRAATELYEQMKFFYMFYRETNQSKLQLQQLVFPQLWKPQNNSKSYNCDFNDEKILKIPKYLLIYIFLLFQCSKMLHITTM